MNKESVTDSEWTSEDSSDSDGSKDEGKRSQRGKKRTTKTGSRKEKEQTKTASVKKSKAASKCCENANGSLKEEMKSNSQLPVTCGRKEGFLYLDKFQRNEKCIYSEEQWFKPGEFESFGGKAKNKKWKESILCCGLPLKKLIQDEFLPLPMLKKSTIQVELNNTSERSNVTDRLRGMKRDHPSSSVAYPQSYLAATKETNSRKRRLSTRSQESKTRVKGHQVNHNKSNKDADEIDMSVFQGPTLPVTCGSVSGVLHKSRFATGHCGKCIRTEDFWLNPKEFIRLSKQDGIWRKDIVTHEIPIGRLIMKRVLIPHTLNCECDVCQEVDHTNDDMCYVCDSEEDLVCCDECPRAFHPRCHVPAVKEDTGQWSCTFCMMKKVNRTERKSRRDILNSPISQYRLHCQHFLLHLLHESSAESCTKILVKKNKTWTQGIIQNLQDDTYQTVGEFVADVEHIVQKSNSKRGNDKGNIEHLFMKVF